MNNSIPKLLVHRRLAARTASAFLAVFLASCGGGGVNSTPAPVPVPSPAPSPTPTPTPVPTNASLPLTVSETFTTASAKVVATVDNKTGTASEVLPSRASYATLSVSYDAAANSYTVADEASSRTFSQADAQPSDAAFKYFRQSSGASASELSLFTPGPTNQRLALTYVTYGVWTNTTEGTSTTRLLSRFTTFGVATTSASMPVSGSATYSGIADGAAVINGQAYRLAGSTGMLTADFATGVVRTTLVLKGNPDPFSTALGVTSLGTLTGTAAIGAGGSRYTGTIDNATMSGSFGGGFYGPGAVETGYAFSTTGATDSAVGVFVGKP